MDAPPRQVVWWVNIRMAAMSSTPVPPSAPEHPWLAGARPRTLPAAVVPVALGAAASVGEPHPVWWRASLALAVSLALQVGVNYANDYSDGVRGTDDVRVGPVRLVAGGLKPAGAVKRAAFATFGVAAVCGLVLAAATTCWLLAVGAVAILAAQVVAAVIPPIGDVIRTLPLIPVGLAAATVAVVVQLIRAR